MNKAKSLGDLLREKFSTKEIKVTPHYSRSSNGAIQFCYEIKESIMDENTRNALLYLANSAVKDEDSDLAPTRRIKNADLAAAVKKAEERKRDEALANLAEFVVQMQTDKDAKIEAYIQRIRQLRAEVLQTKKYISDLNRAEAYGHETNNFLPLAAELHGVWSVVQNDKERALAKVPDDFKMPSTAADTAQSAQ